MTGDQLYLGHPVHSAPGPVHSNARTLTSGSTMQVVVTMTVPKDTKANATAAVSPGGAWVAQGLRCGPRSPCSYPMPVVLRRQLCPALLPPFVFKQYLWLSSARVVFDAQERLVSDCMFVWVPPHPPPPPMYPPSCGRHVHHHHRL